MILTLVGTKKEATDAVSFLFKSEVPLDWQAGQFLHYVLDHHAPDGRKSERYFTIASAPFEGQIMLTTRFAEEGSSFKKALRGLAIGSKIEAEGPDGDFVLDKPKEERIFIAGGIGITPYRAILLDLDHRKLPINAKLLYANRDNDFVYKKELEALAQKHENFKIYYFVSPARIDEEAVRKATPDLKKPTFYVSGPEPMVEAFEKMLQGIGAPDNRVKRDYFPGYDWP